MGLLPPLFSCVEVATVGSKRGRSDLGKGGSEEEEGPFPFLSLLSFFPRSFAVSPPRALRKPKTCIFANALVK